MTVAELEQAPVAVEIDVASARTALRRQIGDLERRLSGAAVELREPSCGAARATVRSPRLLDLAALERERDRLVMLLGATERRLRERDRERAAARARLQAMLEHPARHRFQRVSHAELGEPGCSVYRVQPRLGLLGMLAGWWEVKLSSGCP